MKADETAQEIVNRCKYLFNLDAASPLVNSCEFDTSHSAKPGDHTISPSKSASQSYQLWLKTGKHEPLIPLIGEWTHNHIYTSTSTFIIISKLIGNILFINKNVALICENSSFSLFINWEGHSLRFHSNLVCSSWGAVETGIVLSQISSGWDYCVIK